MAEINACSKSPVEAIKAGRYILLRLPKDQNDIRFIRSLGHSRWDSTGFCWVVQNFPANEKRLSEYFSGRIKWHDQDGKIKGAKEVVKPGDPDSLLVIKYHQDRIRLIFCYNSMMVAKVKQLPLYSWDSETKSWTLPHTEKVLAQLRYHCNILGWRFRYIEDVAKIDRKQKPKPSDVPNFRKCPESYIERLTAMRYSPRTIIVYRECFVEFINYFNTRELSALSHEDIIRYMRYLIEERGISTSYQNQAINAIKFYYEKIAGRNRETFYIERPRREKFLPEVLSEDEVRRIIGCIVNLKHKCMIMTAYSAGLRVGELLNLRPGDIDSKRMLIRVNQGKGRKDRVTLLSTRLLELLRKYYIQYHPKDFLFEGVAGGKYAIRSVQCVLKRACNDAGITRHVTMHTLRHSFATHLLEHNTDIRYIQELLGHANPKTTQIYTHITTKGLDQLKSPLDNIEL